MYGMVQIVSSKELFFVRQKLFYVHSYIVGNLTQKNWRDISSLVKWYSCAPTVRVSELYQTALLPRF